VHMCVYGGCSMCICVCMGDVDAYACVYGEYDGICVYVCECVYGGYGLRICVYMGDVDADVCVFGGVMDTICVHGRVFVYG